MKFRNIILYHLIFISILQTMTAQEWTSFSEEVLLGRFAEANRQLGDPEISEQRVIFMGNSITEGWPQSHPSFWKEHPNFINRGVSGQTTPQMLLRFRTDVIALKPKIVVILAGTNDIAGNTGDTSIDTIANNIFSMAELAKFHGIKVIICSILPVFDYPWKPGLAPAQTIIDINTLLKRYADRNGHYYLDYHSKMKNEKNGLIDAYTTDGVHITTKGYKVMDKSLSPIIEQLVKN